jgi:hypothetical protein
MPVVELTRNSKRAGENGPPRGPEKAMLLAGVTIKDGGDWPAGLCAAPICVNISIADVASKAIETIRPMDMAGSDAFARGVSPRSDTQLV